MMAPKFVAPYRMSGQRRKNIEQQSRLFVHRARQGYVEQRTALINRIRRLLSELGIVLPSERP